LLRGIVYARFEKELVFSLVLGAGIFILSFRFLEFTAGMVRIFHSRVLPIIAFCFPGIVEAGSPQFGPGSGLKMFF